jgi:hypothetical protein
MADFPATNPFQNSLTLKPKGLIVAIPVTTTLGTSIVPQELVEFLGTLATFISFPCQRG